MTDSQSIIADPDIMMGKSVISGTRITVELILEKLASGETMEQILQAHPRLTSTGILAAVHWNETYSQADSSS